MSLSSCLHPRDLKRVTGVLKGIPYSLREDPTQSPSPPRWCKTASSAAVPARKASSAPPAGGALPEQPGITGLLPHKGSSGTTRRRLRAGGASARYGAGHRRRAASSKRVRSVHFTPDLNCESAGRGLAATRWAWMLTLEKHPVVCRHWKFRSVPPLESCDGRPLPDDTTGASGATHRSIPWIHLQSPVSL